MMVGVTENTAFAQKSSITVVVYARLLDEWEEDGFANSESRDGHEQSVDSHAHSAARWHSVFERTEEFFVEGHRFGVTASGQLGLFDKPFPLNDGVDQL